MLRYVVFFRLIHLVTHVPISISLYVIPCRACYTRLPNVATDLLMTVNVPYFDEESAEQSMASAECFTGTVQPDDASSSETPGTTDTISGDPEAKKESVEEGEGPPPTEGDKASLQNVSRQSPDDAGSRLEDSNLGIVSLNILLQSFVILDWSLFC